MDVTVNNQSTCSEYEKLEPLGWLANGMNAENGRIISFPTIPQLNDTIGSSDRVIENGYFYERELYSPIDMGNDTDWHSFKEHWDRLAVDKYMADGGTYRLRRYSTLFFESHRMAILKMPYMPLFKSSSYNSFAGDIFRDFQETESTLFFNPYFQRLLNESLRVFIACENQRGRTKQKWFIEVDQYRITADKNQPGKPTPEGVHSDGTNYFSLMLVAREGVRGGVSSIYDNVLNLKKEVTLEYPGDVIMLDDASMMHGVTSIEPLEDHGVRDILHISFTNLLRPGSINRRFGFGSEDMLTI
ncbi:2OG-Fe dioxygenase family protein [Aeromonas popoffii]|uniref:2OG-Fe dioxygenase family protein n=1 Tax=Aeromonas popoffii TaxID=70856 RepID=UPI0009FF6EED|nr:2OG-Fe dioxygenase family protein [Aeromonas popoffii]